MSDAQEAGSLKWASGSIILRRLSSGRFALYHWGGSSTPFAIVESGDILEAFNNQPPPPVKRPPPPPRKSHLGINLSNIEFDL